MNDTPEKLRGTTDWVAFNGPTESNQLWQAGCVPLASRPNAKILTDYAIRTIQALSVVISWTSALSNRSVWWVGDREVHRAVTLLGGCCLLEEQATQQEESPRSASEQEPRSGRQASSSGGCVVFESVGGQDRE